MAARFPSEAVYAADDRGRCRDGGRACDQHVVVTRTPPPPKQHDPVSVLIADFQKRTGDPTFDGTLEQTLRRGLESAGFITAFDRTRIRAALGVAPPEKLDEMRRAQLAVKQGVGVVLSASIGGGAGGFDISVKASQPMTGNSIVSASGRAASKDRVLEAATKLVTSVRKALGDETSDSAQLLAMRSISTTLAGRRGLYAAAMEAQSKGNSEERWRIIPKAVERDPKFGLGYQGMAAMSQNLGPVQDANKYIHRSAAVPRWHDRARAIRRRGPSTSSGKDDYQQCAKEYGELIKQVSGRRRRSQSARDLSGASEKNARGAGGNAAGDQDRSQAHHLHR